MIGKARSHRGLATHLTLNPRVSRLVMFLALDVLEDLRNLRNLACKLCLGHLMCWKILGIFEILRAGYVWGI